MATLKSETAWGGATGSFVQKHILDAGDDAECVRKKQHGGAKLEFPVGEDFPFVHREDDATQRGPEGVFLHQHVSNSENHKFCTILVLEIAQSVHYKAFNELSARLGASFA